MGSDFIPGFGSQQMLHPTILPTRDRMAEAMLRGNLRKQARGDIIAQEYHVETVAVGSDQPEPFSRPSLTIAGSDAPQ